MEVEIEDLKIDFFEIFCDDVIMIFIEVLGGRLLFREIYVCEYYI